MQNVCTFINIFQVYLFYSDCNMLDRTTGSAEPAHLESTIHVFPLTDFQNDDDQLLGKNKQKEDMAKDKDGAANGSSLLRVKPRSRRRLYKGTLGIGNGKPSEPHGPPKIHEHQSQEDHANRHHENDKLAK